MTTEPDGGYSCFHIGKDIYHTVADSSKEISGVKLLILYGVRLAITLTSSFSAVDVTTPHIGS